jgi:hypothetical protein
MHFMIIGYPRTGTTSIVDQLLIDFPQCSNHIKDIRHDNLSGWLMADASISKMHTFKEYEQYKNIRDYIVHRTDKVIYTRMRDNLEEHLLSYIAIYLCRKEDHHLPYIDIEKVKEPYSNEVVDKYMDRQIYSMINFKSRLDEYKRLPWKNSMEINVFDGFPIHVNSYKNFINEDWFEDLDFVHAKAKEGAEMLRKHGIDRY